MNELLQKHGCSNVFSVPEGLRELMSDISREVLRKQPTNIYEFIANYLAVLLVTREHGILSTKILADLCDCRPSVVDHLMQLYIPKDEAEKIAEVIKECIEKVHFDAEEGKAQIKEDRLLKKVLEKVELDEETMAKVCLVARNAFKDYWYRKMLLEESLQKQSKLPWEIAAQHTLEVYKKTKPSFQELEKATERIQAAYRGYYVRKKMLRRLREKKSDQEDKNDQKPADSGKKTKERETAFTSGKEPEGPLSPLPDASGSRTMEFGRVLDLDFKEDNMEKLFNEGKVEKKEDTRGRQQSRMISTKKDTPLFGTKVFGREIDDKEDDPYDDEPRFYYDPTDV